jgi:hypothetical protein
VEVFDPEGGSLERDSNDLPDAVRLGIHPNVAKEKSLFLAPGNDVQYVLWNHAKILLPQEDEVVIRSADVVLTTFLGRSYFLLQDRDYDLFTSQATLRIGDFESFDVGRRKANLGRYIRNGFRIVPLKYLIFPRDFVGPREGWVLSLRSF